MKEAWIHWYKIIEKDNKLYIMYNGIAYEITEPLWIEA